MTRHVNTHLHLIYSRLTKRGGLDIVTFRRLIGYSALERNCISNWLSQYRSYDCTEHDMLDQWIEAMYIVSVVDTPQAYDCNGVI